MKAGANIGSVIGQFTFGYLADALGRKAVCTYTLLKIYWQPLTSVENWERRRQGANAHHRRYYPMSHHSHRNHLPEWVAHLSRRLPDSSRCRRRRRLPYVGIGDLGPGESPKAWNHAGLYL